MDDAKQMPAPPEPNGKPTPPSWRTTTRPAATPSVAAQKWLDDNREAIDEFNGWYEKNGSPLDEYRMF